MKKPKKNLADLTAKEKEIVLDESLTPEVVSFMLYMPVYRIMQIRYQEKHRTRINENVKQYRKRIRDVELQKYGGSYATHRGWPKEEEELLIKYIKENKTHREIAELLNRSTYSISKKYNRLIKEQNNVR